MTTSFRRAFDAARELEQRSAALLEANAQLETNNRKLELRTAELARLNALWQPSAAGARTVRMAGRLGPDGRPSGCELFESSGSDAADVAAHQSQHPCQFGQSRAHITHHLERL